MAGESKQYNNFDLQVTEEKIIVTVKAGTSMFNNAMAMPSELLAITKTILPNGDLQMTRIRTPQNHMRDIMFAASAGVDPESLGPNPWVHLDRAVERPRQEEHIMQEPVYSQKTDPSKDNSKAPKKEDATKSPKNDGSK